MENPAMSTQNRIGFYYFPDTLHYRQIDLDTWLPELQRMGASWLALAATPLRAIPESFIHGLLQAGIQPVLHFPFACTAGTGLSDSGQYAAAKNEDGCSLAVSDLLPACPPVETLRLLLESYARWGVRYAVFFDRPNCRCVWPAPAWLQGDLVERFLDLFIPVASLALQTGLTPVFPPLAPGGDYWDLSFMRSALRGLKRRDSGILLESLVLGAEAWVGDHPLAWGAGGPQHWPGARPYQPSPALAQDQRGFRIFDWYLTICREELGRSLPMILLRAGQRQTGMDSVGLPEKAASDPATTSGQNLAAGVRHARQNLEIAQLLAAGFEAQEAIPEEVLACHFWLLSAEHGHPAEADAWFPPTGLVLPVGGALKQWTDYIRSQPTQHGGGDGVALSIPQPESGQVDSAAAPVVEVSTEEEEVMAKAIDLRSIDHYVLLPLYAWGAANWDLALVQPLLQDSHPTIGFSLAEARLARRVTVVGGPGAISTDALAMLRRSGCQVERLSEDGIVFAS